MDHSTTAWSQRFKLNVVETSVSPPFQWSIKNLHLRFLRICVGWPKSVLLSDGGLKQVGSQKSHNRWKYRAGLEFQRSDIRASLNLSLFGAFGVGSLVAFRIVFDFWRSFKYLIQIRTFRLFSKCSKFSRRYTWHNVSAINYDFFERFMVFHFIRSKLLLNIISSLIKYHYCNDFR